MPPAPSSRHLVDPELVGALELMPPYHTIGADTLAELRAGVAAAAKLQVDATDRSGVVVREASAPGPAGAPPVRIAIYRPAHAAGDLPALLHIHGGGMVMGLPEMRHASLVATARDLGCVVASVDYRLAPETPCPGGLEDCYAALVWLAGGAASLGIDPGRIVLAGESAGGGLAAGLALLARDRGEVRPIAQMLTYPMLDDRTVMRGAPALAGEFVWGPAANRYGWSALLGREPGGAEVPAYAAPARARDLAGLPPAFIGVGALDLFLEEDLDYARRLAQAGTPVELHVYPGAFHGFDAIAAATVSRVFRTDWTRALRKAFG